MAMGITQALKLQEGPIDALARLPQQQLIQMSQQGRIPADILPVILNEKAQMAQQMANMQAAQQPQPPSVIEQAMSINAQSEAQRQQPPQMQPQMGQPMPPQMQQPAPQMMPPQAPPRESGIANLPIPESMYGGGEVGNYAGGGIVAFGDGGNVEHFQAGGSPFSRDISSWAEAQRQSMLERTPGMLGAYGKPMVSPEEEERMRLLQIVNQKYGPAGSLIQGYFMNQSPEERTRAKDIVSRAPQMSIEELRDLAGSSGTGRQTDIGFGPGKFTPTYGPQDVVGSSIKDVERMVYQEPKAAPRQEAPPAKQAETPKPIKSEDEKNLQSFYEQRKALMPEGDAYADLEQQILSDREARKADKEQAAWMRLAEAGFGMMAGESPYGMVNIGRGAAAAMKGYAEDLKEQKKLDREDRKFLADIKQARRAEEIGNIDKASTLYQHALDNLSAEKRTQMSADATLAAARMSASKPSQYAELRSDLLSKDPDRVAMAKSFLGSGKTGAITEEDIYKAWNDAQKDPLIMGQLKKQGITNFSQFAASQRAMISGAGGAGWGIREIK